MTSSGKTRGLAAAAVGAVTLGLLPLMSSPAYAASASDGIYGLGTGVISTLNDGATSRSTCLPWTRQIQRFSSSTRPTEAPPGPTLVPRWAPPTASSACSGPRVQPPRCHGPTSSGGVEIQAQGLNADRRPD